MSKFVLKEWKGEEFKREIMKKLELDMDVACEMITNEMKIDVPYRTGKLMNSLRPFMKEIYEDRILGHVGSDLDYSVYVELGTIKQKKQPYMRPALDGGNWKEAFRS